MSENILYKTVVIIKASLTDEKIKERIRESLNGIDTIYSYLVYAKYKDDTLIGWRIEYNVSQNDYYNTLSNESVTEEITKSILESRSSVQSVLSYKQPSIELMIELYRPLMKKLTLEQCSKWQNLEYEDAYSICQLTMVTLYKKGYYVHKNLLRRSFQNAILMELRHERNKPEMYSLEQIIHDDGDADAITLADVIPDEKAEIEKQEKEEREEMLEMFNELKEILADTISERQFQQLLRDYGKKHTSTWSRMRIQKIKEKMNKLGITWDSLRRNL